MFVELHARSAFSFLEAAALPEALAERAARHLSELLGADQVMSHHGSMAKELRLRAEQRLKNGELKVLVATASLELGIDIGDVELVCQLGSPACFAATGR